MEFHEKLQELRKNRGLTQEELAEALYVSRTAISKWESGRGYPSIDSLKEISKYFSVSIDDLLSGEKLLSIAEKENTSNIRSMCHLLFGIIDVCSLLLIVLPLYPHSMEGHVYSVNLFHYVETTDFNRFVYWILFLSLMVNGVVNILFIQWKKQEKIHKMLTNISFVLHIFIMFFLALTRVAYAITVAFLLLLIKAVLLLKYIRCEMPPTSIGGES